MLSANDGRQVGFLDTDRNLNAYEMTLSAGNQVMARESKPPSNKGGWTRVEVSFCASADQAGKPLEIAFTTLGGGQLEVDSVALKKRACTP